MKMRSPFVRLIIVSTMVESLVLGSLSLAQESDQRSSRSVFSHALPALDGKRLKVEGVEVIYGPGAGSPAHRHPCPVIGYVLSGAIRTKVQGQDERVYAQGESFYEPPNGVHLVSSNASNAEPATLLAFFVCDHDAELSTPVKEGKR
jgi:quercetin dioxygenase-like cupin family protein